MNSGRILAVFALGLSVLLPSTVAAKECRVSHVVTHTGNVRDLLATPDALWVASDGGLQEFERSTRKLLRTYTHLDGLTSLAVSKVSMSQGGSVEATVNGATCSLRGDRFECRKSTQGARAQDARTQGVLFKYHEGVRVTVQKALPEGPFIGTAGGHAFVGGARLSAPALPDRHITALALFRDRLWVGTFNGGLAKEDARGEIRPLPSPGKLINALVTGPDHLFLGTADGLFKTKDGLTFEQVEMVEQAVVGLASDGTSIWVTTPGALYRIRDGRGPKSDVWWVPGGSRSLQKVSAVPGYVWFGTEDRGAIRMTLGPQTVARDKPFTVYDRGQGLASSWSLAVAARPDGSAWMTTLREGVTFIPHHGQSVKVQTGVSDWGLSALATQDGVFVGSQNGATFLDKTGEHTSPLRYLPDERVHAFLVDDRKKKSPRLWIGTENGLGRCELN